MHRISASLVQFRAGSSIKGKGGSIHPAAQLIVNPLYDYYTIDFDAAVAKVSGYVLFARLTARPVFHHHQWSRD
jgi:hypothetical protein